MQKKATIYDIAKLAGCSPATVSLALNDDKRVKKETKLRVKELAEELNYQVNYFGRSLISGKSKTIKVVLPDIHNPVFVNILDGIESYIGNTDYHLILEVTDNRKDREIRSFSSLYGNQVDGIIISPLYGDEVSDYLEKNGIDLRKVVYVGVSCERLEGVHYCTVDSQKGAYKGVTHMLANGCKKVAFLAPTVTEMQSSRRLEGYKQALKDYGIAPDEKLIVNCRQDFNEIYQTARQLLTEEKPDGIFCLYDYATIPLSKATADLGLRVPEDIMITGYDNIDIGEFFEKPLTTIDTHLKEQGYRAAEIMIAMLEGEERETKNVIEPDLVVRASTRNL